MFNEQNHKNSNINIFLFFFKCHHNIMQYNICNFMFIKQSLNPFFHIAPLLIFLFGAFNLISFFCVWNPSVALIPQKMNNFLCSLLQKCFNKIIKKKLIIIIIKIDDREKNYLLIYYHHHGFVYHNFRCVCGIWSWNCWKSSQNVTTHTHTHNLTHSTPLRHNTHTHTHIVFKNKTMLSSLYEIVWFWRKNLHLYKKSLM